MDAVPTPTIHSEIANKLNFACHQSAFAFLRDLKVENNDLEGQLEDVLVTLTSNPAFLRPKSWRLDRISPGGTVSIKDRDIQLDGGFLLNLSDAVQGTILISVEQDGVVIAEETKPVELLAYNEWGGAGYMPELLAAFSLPNDPAVDRILHDASLVLRKAGKPDGLDGYKSGSRERVWEIASAIYTAIANLGISYAVPPASFEENGQKIRLPSQILENRVATCLDAAMLFTSALEQAGLNPVVTMPQEHAVVGVWLQPEELSTIVIDEAETLRKRIQLKELALIETTFVTGHPAPPFSKAVKAAAETISPDKDETFNSAVDIRRARAHRINPLGLKVGDAPRTSGLPDGPVVELPFEQAPPLPDFDSPLGDEVAPDTPEGRLERWQRKLLDLTARNPLLNHKSTKSSLRILCPLPGLLEDKLAEGARISIHSVPQPSTEGQDQDLHLRRTGEVISEEYAQEALDKRQVLVDLPKDELSRCAVEIFRKARTALQEGGSNTLYLALGFLLWKRDEKDERRFRAPLILLPVTLERKSVRSGIKMLAHDDETRFNTTLLQMLRQDFGIDIVGLDGLLPEDHSGVDVGGVWNTVRRAVKEAPGFEVVEDVVLGHFSFAKYLMWKDLVDRTDALRENAVVKHLIDTPRDSYPSEISFVQGKDIDRDFKPSDLLVPLPADSSQMAAIATADRGKDFIVIGPPGTGKSQTISNLIAHMLGKGKTVLFISEKTAALEVVFRRLKEIGLGRYCLELHSNKARKADVLNQLGNAWALIQEKQSSDWAEEAEKLLILRDQINLVVDQLHVVRRNGMTAHYAMGVKIRDEDLATRAAFTWPNADHHDQSHLTTMRDSVEKLRVQVAAVGDVSESPFLLVAHGDWSPQWEAQIVEKAGQLSGAAATANQKCDALLGAIGIKIADRTMSRLGALGELATALAESYRKQIAFALEPDGLDIIDALEEAVRRLTDYSEAQAQLSCPYEPSAWRELDGDEIGQRWQEAEEAWWPKKFFVRRQVIKDLRSAGAKGTPDPSLDAGTLNRLRTEGEAIDRLSKLLSGFKDWESHLTDPKKMLSLQTLGQRMRTAVGKLADEPQLLAETRGKIRTLLHDGNDLLAPEAIVGRATEAFLEAVRDLENRCDAFEAIAGQSVRDHFLASEKALDAMKDTADSIARRHAELREWCGWRRRRIDAMDLELGPLVEAIEDGRVPTEEIEDTFEAAYCTWWSSAVIGEDDVLRTFSTPEHVATIEKFREIDTRFQALTAAHIAAKLAGQLPDTGEVGRKSSWGILQRELQKKRQHKPVRQLIKEIPDVLTSLAPCLMMSPLSVAQYLPADQALFDVVIFDEASQIAVWDAAGALARGKQAIVAGDPKQMPPSNFFARADDDPGGDVDFEGDLESILDEMRGASIPEHTLNLHYRSRRESLIAFSNSRYYDNSLVTFPAPVNPDRGVRLIQPEGFYSRGKSRQNVGEARSIVAEILRRLTHDDSEVRELSIGVVTFNTEQQTLIENLLDEARGSNPGIEWAFSEDHRVEPVFVKNLETVQGDERDVILFSITFGPDQSNHVTMNFGPLNREGGERRLNVAMTRARSEMIVFSTLEPDRIDLSRTQARAVADLKHFLEYADRGPSALGASVYGSIGDFESPLESAIARALRDKRWDVHPQIGVSAYRIDLGIVHPDAPGIYLAGVECDGAMYHSSAYARERDKIRQSVLEGLGWSLFRVWSTDWWTNKEKALGNLNDALLGHLELDRQRRRDAKEAKAATEAEARQSNEDLVDPKPPHMVEIEEDEENFSEEFAPDAFVNAPSAVPLIEPQRQRQIGRLPRNLKIEPESDQAPQAPSEDLLGNDAHNYIVTRFDSGRHLADPGSFYDDEYKHRLTAMIDHVIDSEGPIHEDVLVRRIARHHDFKRAGRQIRDIVINLAKTRRSRTTDTAGLFFWRKRTVKDRYAPARYKNRDEEMRKIEYISTQELRAIQAAVSSGTDPIELARHIGISRLSNAARNRLETVIRDDDDQT
jgi:very-short-patch-repair endonuclease